MCRRLKGINERGNQARRWGGGGGGGVLGGGVVPVMTCTGRLRPKGVPFPVFRYMKR